MGGDELFLLRGPVDRPSASIEKPTKTFTLRITRLHRRSRLLTTLSTLSFSEGFSSRRETLLCSGPDVLIYLGIRYFTRCWSSICIFVHNLARSQCPGGCAFFLSRYTHFHNSDFFSSIFYYVSSYVGAEKSRFQSYPFFSQHARQGTAAFCIAL